MNNTPRLVIILTCMGLLIIGMGLIQSAKSKIFRDIMEKRAQQKIFVTVVRVKKEKYQERVHATGSIRAIQQIDINPASSGIIKNIHVNSGQRVKKGDPIVSLDHDIHQANLVTAEANLEYKKIFFQREERLYKDRGTSKESLDKARADRDSALGEYQESLAKFEQKIVKAPFSGQLGLKRVDVGQYVTTGTPLFNLQDKEILYVDFEVPSKYIKRIQVGDMIEFKTDVYPHKVFHAAIVALDAAVTENSRNLTIRAKYKNTHNQLLPGLFASVQILTSKIENVIYIPETAISTNIYGNTVYVVENNKTILKFVTTGTRSSGRVIILDGLSEGQMVVNAGQTKIYDGASIEYQLDE